MGTGLGAEASSMVREALGWPGWAQLCTPRAQLGAVAPAVSGSGGPGPSMSLHVPQMSSLRSRSFWVAGEREDRKEGREFQPTIVQLLMLLRVFRQGV